MLQEANTTTFAVTGKTDCIGSLRRTLKDVLSRSLRVSIKEKRNEDGSVTIECFARSMDESQLYLLYSLSKNFATAYDLEFYHSREVKFFASFPAGPIFVSLAGGVPPPVADPPRVPRGVKLCTRRAPPPHPVKPCAGWLLRVTISQCSHTPTGVQGR